MRQINLTRGLVALIDDVDFEWISDLKWRAQVGWKGWNKTQYAARAKRIDGRKTSLYMHREIARAMTGQPLPVGSTVDHRDGNGLNNRRENIRICSQAENNRNVGRNRRNKSGFKGVSWHKGNKKWYAKITCNGRVFFLGMFSDTIDAAKAYDAAAKKYHGEFAFQNFPDCCEGEKCG